MSGEAGSKSRRAAIVRRLCLPTPLLQCLKFNAKTQKPRVRFSPSAKFSSFSSTRRQNHSHVSLVARNLLLISKRNTEIRSPLRTLIMPVIEHSALRDRCGTLSWKLGDSRLRMRVQFGISPWKVLDHRSFGPPCHCAFTQKFSPEANAMTVVGPQPHRACGRAGVWGRPAPLHSGLWHMVNAASRLALQRCAKLNASIRRFLPSVP